MTIAAFRRRLAGYVAGALFVLMPVASVAETLTDALISAYRNSGLLEQNRALLRAADENVAVAVSALRPTISYAISAGWSQTAPAATSDGTTLSATLSANLLLYDFGRTRMGVDLARENVMMTREMLIGVEQQVLLRAVTAYLKVRSTAETAQLQSNNVRLINQELQAARDRFEVGEITQTDVSQAEAALAAARAAEAAAAGALLIAREEYKAAVGHYPAGILAAPPAPPVTVKTLEEARALARERHPDMLAARRQVTVAELSVNLAEAAMKPTLSASASRTWAGVDTSTYSTDTGSSKLGVTLGGTIYAGGKLSALYRQAIAQAEAARAALHISQIGVEQNVSNAWSQLAIAAASLEATDRQIRATRVALRGTREEQALGARTTLDVLNAEQDLLDAQANAIGAQSDQYTAVYTLLAAMGLLTADHLHLGIATYDPEAYYNTVQTAPVTTVSPQGEKLDAMLDALMKNPDGTARP